MNALKIFEWVLANKGTILGDVAAVVAAASVLAKALELLVRLLVWLFPGLKGVDGELQSVAAWLDRASKWGPLNAVALSPKAKLLLLLVGLGLFVPSPARAAGLDWSAGPTVPMLEYDFGNPHPLQLAPGAGAQLSVTHDIFKRTFFGRTWDLLDLNVMVFGSVVSAASGQSFGAFSAALGACAMSSLVCVGGGKHILAVDRSFTKGGWFLILAANFNFDLAPPAAPPPALRANTMHFGPTS